MWKVGCTPKLQVLKDSNRQPLILNKSTIKFRFGGTLFSDKPMCWHHIPIWSIKIHKELCQLMSYSSTQELVPGGVFGFFAGTVSDALSRALSKSRPSLAVEGWTYPVKRSKRGTVLWQIFETRGRFGRIASSFHPRWAHTLGTCALEGSILTSLATVVVSILSQVESRSTMIDTFFRPRIARNHQDTSMSYINLYHTHF